MQSVANNPVFRLLLSLRQTEAGDKYVIQDGKVFGGG